MLLSVGTVDDANAIAECYIHSQEGRIIERNLVRLRFMSA